MDVSLASSRGRDSPGGASGAHPLNESSLVGEWFKRTALRMWPLR